jgi:hypothetical protein
MNRFEHQQGFSQIPSTIPRDPLVQALHLLPSLLFAHILQHTADLRLRRRSNPHEQRSTPNRRNDITRRIRQQNQSQIGTVLFHRPPQRGLCISRQVIRLIDDHDLEALLCAQVDLLCLCYFLEQVLHDHSVVVANI